MPNLVPSVVMGCHQPSGFRARMGIHVLEAHYSQSFALRLRACTALLLQAESSIASLDIHVPVVQRSRLRAPVRQAPRLHPQPLRQTVAVFAVLEMYVTETVHSQFHALACLALHRHQSRPSCAPRRWVAVPLAYRVHFVQEMQRNPRRALALLV